jgi:hypothetical protein
MPDDLTEAPDEVLLDRIVQMLDRADPVPAAVLAAGTDSLDWRSIDTELAWLTADSLLADAAVRGGDARLLTFESDGYTIDLEATATGTGGVFRITGQITPPVRALVRVEQPTTSVQAGTDPFGRFTVPDVPGGPTRVVCEPADQGPVCTEWTVL